MVLRFLSSLLALCAVSSASLCPIQNHTVCNTDIDVQHSCVCAMAEPTAAAPEKSCNLLINVNEGKFPVISMTFKLDETARIYNHFPENKFKEEIGSSIKEDEENIIILRQGCPEDNEHLVVQFVVKDKNSENAQIPYQPDDFLDPTKLVRNMKVIGLTHIADIALDETVATDKLIEIEGNVDNTFLLIEGAITLAAIVLMSLLGIWFALRKSSDEEPEYSDNLQKA
uniref:Secreted protein n=1 Tax=Panagrellus redivivus TaxID=6233 RepID=A0A7E4W0A6_PANRE